MPIFLVRKNCEWSVTVEADDEDLAMQIAENLPDDKWNESWSDIDAEEQ